MIELISLEQISASCPSQWEGLTADGEEFYARYRHGWLSVDINDIEVLTMHVGTEYAGVMDTVEMLALTGYTFKEEPL